ncbi:MAG: dihydropteroate synthase [Eubacteriales bacterium]|nr:dihydropteroate synthase [Eubacteriales bacterium]
MPMIVSSSQNPTNANLFQAGSFSLPLGKKTYILGILNITPDSFSDGGRYLNVAQALSQAERLIDAGADILDIGGESTRPGSRRVSVQAEIERIRPVIAQLASRVKVPISVDTFKPEVAEAALSAGATIVNDVTGLLAYPQMADVVTRYQAGIILMHNAALYRTGHPAASVFTNLPAIPSSIVHELRRLPLLEATRRFLQIGCDTALHAGVRPTQIILDPGIGFGLLTDESLELIAEIENIQCLPDQRLPILAGPSRKRFIGELLGRPLEDRAVGTAAAVAAAIARGADFVRVHDVDTVAQAARVCDAILRRPRLGGSA